MRRFVLLPSVLLMFSSTVASANPESFRIEANAKGIVVQTMSGLIATASSLSYDSAVGRLLLNSSADSFVVVTRASDGNRSELRALTVTVSLKDGRIMAEGIKGLQMAPVN